MWDAEQHRSLQAAVQKKVWSLVADEDEEEDEIIDDDNLLSEEDLKRPVRAGTCQTLSCLSIILEEQLLATQHRTYWPQPPD
jgi:hypothetical protein